jgi:hypothetical protein
MLSFLDKAFRTQVRHPIILLGDTNVDLRADRSQDIASAFSLLGLADLADYFPCSNGRWTWSQCRLGRYIQSATDCALTEHPQDFPRWTVKIPRHYHSDHHTIVVELHSVFICGHHRYLRR